LKSVIESVMMDIMFEAPSLKNVGKVIITRDVVKGRKEAKVIKRESA